MNDNYTLYRGGNTFQVKRARQAVAQESRVYYRVNRGNGPHWDMPNNDVDSVSHAILERVFFTKTVDGFRPAPKPYDAELYPGFNTAERIQIADTHILQQTKSFRIKMYELILTDGQLSPLTTDEFLACYGGRKLKVYQHAVESLNEKLLSDVDCRVKTFTKDEYRKPGGAPRAIQPRTPRYNVMMGRYIKHLEHKMFGYIDRIFDPEGDHRTVAKGMSMEARGETIHKMWTSFHDPVAIGLDASRFDQHINPLLLNIEHDFYRAASTGVGELMPTLNYLLRHQVNNVGRYYDKHGNSIKYNVIGNRMSGDMNTSLGNVLIMCCLMNSYLIKCGLEGQAKLLNDGDDCVLIMESCNVKRFRKGMEYWFRRMGITMCYDGIYTTLEKIEFCQARPVNISGHYRLIPRPTKRLYSDLVSTKHLASRKVYHKWMGAVAGCGLAGSDGVPIFKSFYKWVARSSYPWVPDKDDYYYKFRNDLTDGMQYSDKDVVWESRVSFYHAFDITPQEQLLLEKYYDDKAKLQWSKPMDGETTWEYDVEQTVAQGEQRDISL